MDNRTTQQRSTRGPVARSVGTFILPMLAVLAVIVGCTVATSGRAHAAQPAPYGGCKEAYQHGAPQSAGADWCRSIGWVIALRTPYRDGYYLGVIVNPHAELTYLNLPQCKYEDGGPNQPCSWNLGPKRSGNGRGLAYWVDSSQVSHYVWRTPVKPGWHRVSRALDASLAEAGYDSVNWLRWRYKRVDGGGYDLRSPNGRRMVIW